MDRIIQGVGDTEHLGDSRANGDLRAFGLADQIFHDTPRIENARGCHLDVSGRQDIGDWRRIDAPPRSAIESAPRSELHGAQFMGVETAIVSLPHRVFSCFANSRAIRPSWPPLRQSNCRT